MNKVAEALNAWRAAERQLAEIRDSGAAPRPPDDPEVLAATEAVESARAAYQAEVQRAAWERGTSRDEVERRIATR